MNHRLQLVAATLAGVLVTVAAGGIAFASMDHGMRMGPFARAEWIAAANARFDKFDTNKDGKLVVGEVPPAPSRDFGPRHGPHGLDGPEDGPAAPEQAPPGNAN